MKKNKLAVLTSCLVLSGTFCTQAQNKTPQEIRIPDTYKLTNKSIYRNGWIDFNKNGKKDVYEDPMVPIDARVEDLLSQMNVEEKTCQMVTLYGYKRVLKDDLPTSDWKKQLWKDGIGAIDEHLNGFQQWGLPPSDNPYVWPASRHAWALNEVQRVLYRRDTPRHPDRLHERRHTWGRKLYRHQLPDTVGIGTHLEPEPGS